MASRRANSACRVLAKRLSSVRINFPTSVPLETRYVHRIFACFAACSARGRTTCRPRGDWRQCRYSGGSVRPGIVLLLGGLGRVPRTRPILLSPRYDLGGSEYGRHLSSQSSQGSNWPRSRTVDTRYENGAIFA